MKKQYVQIAVIVAVFFSGVVSAKDIESTTTEIRGDLDLSLESSNTVTTGLPKSVSTEKYASTALLFYPLKNVGVGASWNYGSTVFESEGIKSERVSKIIGPLVAYQIGINSNFNIKLFGSVAMANVERRVEGSSARFNGFAFNFGGGVSYFLSDSVSLDIFARIARLTLKYESTDASVTDSKFGTGVGISIYLM
ncbi:MAG: porin family protein [Gammaproteobacteria bacterium]|nr:porin family protein [Gammaproteobacteria bacterium]